MKKYRTNGAIGALLDEYEKAMHELRDVISTISQHELTAITDSKTDDPDCRSIQTILTHIVRSGYGYAIVTRKWLGEDLEYRKSELLDSVAAYQNALSEMFQYNVKLFDDYPNIVLEEMNNSKKINVRWGQQYDVEQLMEHAIVHVLRHRRQIERFLLKLRRMA